MVRILHHSDNDGLLGAVGVSVLLHVVIVLLVVLGLPIFWEPEVLPGAVGIELAELSDITAAPVPQQLGPPKEQPKPEPPKPEVKKEAPKKEAPPPPAPKPAAAPPPPPAEEVAEAIPDPEAEKKKEEDKKKEEEKKKKEEEKKKKKEEEKKKKEEAKKQKQEDEALNDLLSSVLQETPAPEPDKKPEKKANPEPAEPTTGELTENASPVRLTASQEDGYRRQLIPNWNFDAGIANPENYVVTVRIDLAPDGTVLRAEIQDTSRMSDPVFRSVAETARRAPLKLGRFDVRPGETVPPQIDIVFDLAKAINGSY